MPFRFHVDFSENKKNNMMNMIRKVREYGLRKIFLLLIVRWPLSVKVLFYRVLLSDNTAVLVNSKIVQPTQFVGRGKIFLTDAFVGVWPSPGLFNGASYFEARSPGAMLKIGSGTFINNNATIIVDRTTLVIGNNCLIGPNFFATDSDFHGLHVVDRMNGNYECKPVILEDDVFVGEGVRILKGVTVGSGSVIGSGSLVIKDVPPNTLVAGIPASKIRSLGV